LTLNVNDHKLATFRGETIRFTTIRFRLSRWGCIREGAHQIIGVET
jgi:hypothetical protein